MLKVKNWSSHQSYKDRRPPWIRFQKSILDDYEYQSMSADARALLPMLWLLASEDEDPVSGLIRISYETITFRLRMDKKLFLKTLEELILAGFIIDLQATEKQACNETVTEPYSNRNQTVTPEAYSKETEKKEYLSDLESFWQKYPRKEKKKEAEKAYVRAIKISSHADIMAGLDKYLSNKPSYADWAHPSSWLNGERWKDNYESKVSTIPAQKSKNMVAGSEEWKKEMGML